MMKLIAVTLILSSFLDRASARRRRAFPSFQDDTTGVLTSIYDGEYSQVYVQYHRCIWSEYGGDDGNAGCGGGGGEGGNNDYWYMGNTGCYRANVAYSLYGIKVGQEIPENPCRRQHYINSLFTTDGVGTFGSAVGLANYGAASSSCTVSDNENNEGNGDNNQEAGTHNVMMFPNANSYTTYCNSGKFVTALFDGARCSGTNHELELLESLDDLNGEIENVSCNLVYDAANENNGERNLEEEQDNGGNNGGNLAGLWDLLTFSSVCSLVQYRGACPDPFGAKSSFDMNPSTSNNVVKQMGWVDWLAFVFLFMGAALLGMSCCMKDRRNSGATDTKRSSKGLFGRSRSRPRTEGTTKSLRRSRSPGQSTTPDVEGDAKNTTETKKGFFRRLFSFRRTNKNQTAGP